MTLTMGYADTGLTFEDVAEKLDSLYFHCSHEKDTKQFSCVSQWLVTFCGREEISHGSAFLWLLFRIIASEASVVLTVESTN